ncbi:hypothetical protein SLS58_008550 [Diplodia intermedia]|uniref:Uncharacterized protein n=1 Tax=Diplodia intermedia TaxID=856260 RepID=A0ABR3TH44_9PEZI
MHDEQHRKRQMAVDERIIEKRRAIVIKRSTLLQNVFGYSKVNEPFLAPPPLSSADTVSPPIVPSATAFQKDPQSLSSTTASTEWAPTAADLGKDEPTPLLSEAAASITELMGNDFLPHASTHSKEQSNVHPSSKKHSGHHASAGPARRKYHPDLLTFTFPAAPPSEDMTEFQMSDSVSTAGEDPQAFRDTSMPAPSFSPQSAASSEFNIWEDKDDVDAEGEYCEDEQETVQNNVISDVSLKHKGTSGKDGNTSQSLPQYHPAPQPPRQPATQCNVVPNLEDVFDQWFRFGRKNWEGLSLLEPREIPIESITARTVPCHEPYVPKELREKPVKLFTIAAKHDAAEIKMFEIEVLPKSEKARKALFKLNDRGVYHETSTVNSNVWTVLFIREKAPRFMGYGSKGPGKPEDETGTGVHVAKKIRRGQGPDVEEAPMLGEDSAHHSWQIVAWPSVHASRVLEVLGPVRDNKMEEMDNSKAPQGKPAATGRPPLAPKLAQVRQTPPPKGTGRVHLKDARAYTEYKTTARARAEMKQQFAGDAVFEDGENSPLPLQHPFCFKVVDAIKGHVTKKSAGMSGLTIDGDGGDNNSVLVGGMQRLTCLRFQRGGTYPLLTGKGVDLNYWNTFCEYFCKGEVQLEVFSPADGEPVVLSEEEQQRRRSTGPSDTLSQGAADINNANRASNYRVGAFGTGGRTSDTPIPEPMRSAMEHNRVDQPDSTPLLQRQNTPYGTQNGPPQHGTRDGYRFQSNAQNTQRHKSLHQLPSPIKPSLHPQHSRVNSDSAGGFTVRPQHRDHHRDTSAEFIKVFADADADADSPTNTPTAKRRAFGREFGDGPSRTDPLLRGWQMEMLDALGNHRSPAWDGWTDRSIYHDKRMKQIEVISARIAEEAFTCPSKIVRVLHDDRALRDGNVMVQHYEAEAERRHAEYENLKKLRWYRQQVASDNDDLRKREQHFQPLEYMEDVRSKATQRECEKGRMSPSAGLRVLRKTLRAGEGQKLEELQQLQQQQQREHQRRQEEHRKQIQQQLQQQSRLQALGAYGVQDRPYGSHHQQHRPQAQHVPGSYGQPFAPSTFSYGGAPQQQQQHPATVGGHGYHQSKAPSVPPNMTYAQHCPYRGPSQPTYGRVQQQHIGQNFNGQMDAPLPPVTQQQERAPPSAAAAAAVGPSYFVWGHVPSAMAAAAEETRANDGKAMKSSWAAVEDEDDDDSEDDYFENGWY